MEHVIEARKVSGETLDKRELLKAVVGLKKGNFTARLPGGWMGLMEDRRGINEVIEMNQSLAAETERLSRVVGQEGVYRSVHRSGMCMGRGR